MRSTLAARKLMIFCFRKIQKEIMESKRKTSSSGASCDGISLCIYLALLAIFASPSICIKLYGYDLTISYQQEYILWITVQTVITKFEYRKTIEEGSLIYAEVQPEIKLRFCMYEAAYTVSALKKSNVYDDVVFITKNSRLLKYPIYPLNEGACRSIWQNKNFALPGFGGKTFKVNNSVTEKILQRASETTYAEEHSQRFMKKNREGAMYVELVEWVSPTGVKLIGNVMINAKLYIGTVWGKLIQRNFLSFKDPLGFSKIVFNQNHIF